jgi:hypothetical protein
MPPLTRAAAAAATAAAAAAAAAAATASVEVDGVPDVAAPETEGRDAAMLGPTAYVDPVAIPRLARHLLESIRTAACVPIQCLWGILDVGDATRLVCAIGVRGHTIVAVQLATYPNTGGVAIRGLLCYIFDHVVGAFGLPAAACVPTCVHCGRSALAWTGTAPGTVTLPRCTVGYFHLLFELTLIYLDEYCGAFSSGAPSRCAPTATVLVYHAAHFLHVLNSGPQ